MSADTTSRRRANPIRIAPPTIIAVAAIAFSVGVATATVAESPGTQRASTIEPVRAVAATFDAPAFRAQERGSLSQATFDAVRFHAEERAP